MKALPHILACHLPVGGQDSIRGAFDAGMHGA
jgi:hypothetical protein